MKRVVVACDAAPARTLKNAPASTRTSNVNSQFMKLATVTRDGNGTVKNSDMALHRIENEQLEHHFLIIGL